MIGLVDVEAAAARITGKVRRTPLIAAERLRRPVAGPGHLSLKLENLQVSGSFKARGVMSKLATLAGQSAARHLVTCSGGNHGLAVAYGAMATGATATIFLPEGVAADKIAKLRGWGARLEIVGPFWEETNRHAVAFAEASGAAYLHPFADPAVIAGQGTLALELLADAPDLDTLLVAIGGGGLIAGVSLAAKALKPSIRVIGVEPVGAATLHDSVKAGRVIELAGCQTAATTLAARTTAPLNFDIVRANVDEVVLVSDDEMRAAARWLWFEQGIAAELGSSAACGALVAGRYLPRPGEHVCAVVCGAGTDGLDQGGA